ncbi:putative ankyrin repeat-containing domain-containing protein [Helianthus annuus]|nr:putative ankyrin repeat-containing domain-containing protein [Helianthus annuus]
MYEAVVEGCWWKAKSILNSDKNTATEVITTANGNTILHMAVEMGHNNFVEKLLEFLEDEKDIEIQNYMGQTALHIAAMVGNTYATHLLVQKRRQLLEIEDHNHHLPFYIASINLKNNTSTYLFRSTPLSVSTTYPDYLKEYALYQAITSCQYGKLFIQGVVSVPGECLIDEHEHGPHIYG